MPIVSLTAAFTKSVQPPPSGSVEYWDEKTAGLCLRVFASGKSSWSFRYRPRNGVRYERITLGTLSALTLADARDRAAKLRSQVIDGKDPQRTRREEREAAKNILTFEKLATRYLAEYAKPRKSSWRQDEIYLKRPRAEWGDRPAQAISRKDIVGLLDRIKETAPVSANRTHSILSILFNWALDSELVQANPIAGLKKRAKEEAKERTLTADELRILLQALEERKGVTIDVADALKLIILTGQRPGEIVGLVRSELRDLGDPDQARVEFPAARMKARRPHVLPLAPCAHRLIADVIQRRSADGDGISVFASKFARRETLARHSLSGGLARLVAGLDPEKKHGEVVRSLQADPPTPHDLRRTVATGLAALGVSREDRKAVFAHSESDVHGIHYDKYERSREKRAALQLWETYVTTVVGREVKPLLGAGSTK